MARGKYALVFSTRIDEFQEEFIPDGLIWRKCSEDENPFEEIVIIEGTYLVYISFFRAARLKLPFDSLLVDLLRQTRFHIGKLTPDTVRIVLGVAELNRHFGLSLGINEIKYCYGLNQVEGR